MDLQVRLFNKIVLLKFKFYQQIPYVMTNISTVEI